MTFQIQKDQMTRSICFARLPLIVHALYMMSLSSKNHKFRNPWSASVIHVVHGIQYDGLQLQARSQKYGKFERGQLLTVLPYLVRSRKQHFHRLEQYRVDLILGCNGFIWVGEYVKAKDDTVEDQGSKLEQ
ncbi:hypothetical protein ACJW30_08G008800 [Castanea mollissima]